MNRAKTGGIVGMAAFAAMFLWAQVASASVVSVTGGNTVRVAETGNETNKVAVSYEGGTDLFTVVDTAANLTPSAPCVMVDAHTATCPGAGITKVNVETGDRDDTILVNATVPSTITESLDGGGSNDSVTGGDIPGTVQGGSGNDSVRGRGTVEGGSGNDTVVGTALAETIRGGSGRDVLNGGDGADDIAGGSSTDAVVYPAERTTPINVTVGSGTNNDGGAEDQTANKRDNVRGDVEIVFGTVAGDVLLGDSSRETLVGNAGNDLLVGNRGGDTLLGFEGDDLISGGEGNDVGRGSFGADRLLGGPGGDRLLGGDDNDFIKGKSGADAMKGKNGIDQIRARDGQFDVKISCGPGPNGAEFATRDRRLDPRAKSC